MSFRHITSVEEALCCQLLLGLTIFGFIKRFALVSVIFASSVPFLLLSDLLKQVSLPRLIRVLVLDHVVVLARLAKERQDVDLVKLVHVR